MMSFLLGLWLGGALGVLVMCIVAMGKDKKVCRHCGAPQ